MDKYERACQIWAVLAYAASKSQIITYAELGDATGLPRQGLTSYLGLLQKHCKDEDMPPITALVVSRRTGKPEDGFNAVTQEEWPAALQQIFQHEWTYDKAPTPKSLGSEE